MSMIASTCCVNCIVCNEPVPLDSYDGRCVELGLPINPKICDECKRAVEMIKRKNDLKSVKIGDHIQYKNSYGIKSDGIVVDRTDNGIIAIDKQTVMEKGIALLNGNRGTTWEAKI